MVKITIASPTLQAVQEFIGKKPTKKSALFQVISKIELTDEQADQVFQNIFDNNNEWSRNLILNQIIL